MKVKIGSALKDADKVQKYERKDPFPQVPFVEDMVVFDWVSVAIVGGAVVALILLVVLI